MPFTANEKQHGYQPGPKALVCVRALSKVYHQARWFSRQKFVTEALDHVSFEINEGSTLAIVGESGAGKSTLARCLALLEKPSDGEIWSEGTNLLTLPAAQARQARQRIQLIFQDPATALNPRLKAVEVVAEPLTIQHRGVRRDLRDQALQLMEEVGLSAKWGNRLPLEFSGGQRQRLALARALFIKPKVLILDEIFSGLDLPLQAQIVRLLARLKEQRALTYLVISHDLGVVSRMADEVAVLYQGRLVEQGTAERVLSAPQHLHTRALVSAALTCAPHFHCVSN